MSTSCNRILILAIKKFVVNFVTIRMWMYMFGYICFLSSHNARWLLVERFSPSYLYICMSKNMASINFSPVVHWQLVFIYFELCMRIAKLVFHRIFYWINISHECQNPPSLGYCLPSWKILDNSNNVKKRLLKVVTVNLPLYKQL